MAPDLFLLQHTGPVNPGPHVRRQHHPLIQGAVLGTLLGHPLVQLLDAAKQVAGGSGLGLGRPGPQHLCPGAQLPPHSLLLNLLCLWVLEPLGLVHIQEEVLQQHLGLLQAAACLLLVLQGLALLAAQPVLRARTASLLASLPPAPHPEGLWLPANRSVHTAEGRPRASAGQVQGQGRPGHPRSEEHTV